MNLERTLCGAVIVGSLFASGWCAAKAQLTHPRQVALTFNRRIRMDERIVDIMVVPRDSVVALGLEPIDNQVTPEPHSYVVCTLYTERVGVRILDGSTAGPFNEIAFKCAGKRYLFAAMDIR